MIELRFILIKLFASEYFNNNYTNRWIDRGEPIAWPVRSPDITPLDFYLWEHLKSLIYDNNTIDSLKTFKNQIIAVYDNLKYTRNF